MRSRRSLVPLVLATTILGGCAKTIQVKVSLDASGNPVFDKTHHEMAYVKPGDRVAWTCQCPPGTEFTVADLRFVADLDHVIEFALRHGAGDPEKESTALLTDLKSTLSPDEQRNLFRESLQDRWDPGFVDGTERLRGPGRVVKGIRHGLWKFTWKVRLKGNPAAIDEWDPHIVGHEKTY